MAKEIYVGIDGLAKKVGNMYVGVDGIARKIKKGYVGVDGVARLFYDADGGKAEPLYIYLSGWSAIQNADYGRKNSSIWTKAGLAYADDNEYAQITENLVYFKVNMSLLKKDHKKLVIDACMSSVFGYEGYLSWGTGSSPSEPVGYKATIPNSTTRNIYEFDISDKNMSDGYFYIYFKKNSTLQSINIYDVHFE